MSGAPRPAEWPVWLVWLLLVGATATGALAAEAMVNPRIATTLALLLAAVKVRLVFSQYMELRWHHRPLRWLLELWLGAVTAILLITCWLT